MRRTLGIVWIGAPLAAVVVALGLGCGELEGTPPLATPASAAVLLPVAYSMEGVPGPWWRDGAARADFDRDLRTCREHSTEARLTADPDARRDAAYRAFLGCMAELEWKRGAPAPATLAP
jgi:hypothetical protein